MADRAIGEAVDYCAAVQPAMMKWMEPDPAVIAECIRRSPGTRHVLRQYWGDQRPDAYPRFRAQALDRTRHVLAGLRAAGLATSDARGPRVWMEGYNEHVTKDTPRGEVVDFARQEVGLAQALNGLGAGALVGGFSTGFLDEVHLDAFGEALRYCQAHPAAAALHFHEYAGPTMVYGVETGDGRNQWRHPHGPWTGFSDTREAYYRPGLWGWLTLRYRRLLPMLDARGLGNVRFAITESGTDDTPPRPGGQGSGWRDWAGSEWSRGPVGDYADQLHWYMWHITRDARRFVGVVDFGWGTIDPRWNAFDLSQDRGMANRVRARQLELPAEYAPAPPPVVLPPSQPDPGHRPVPIPRPPALPPTTAADLFVALAPRPGEGWGAFAGRMHGHGAADYTLRLGWAVEVLAANGIPASRADVQAQRVPQPSARPAWASPWHRPEVTL